MLSKFTDRSFDAYINDDISSWKNSYAYVQSAMVGHVLSLYAYSYYCIVFPLSLVYSSFEQQKLILRVEESYRGFVVPSWLFTS